MLLQKKLTIQQSIFISTKQKKNILSESQLSLNGLSLKEINFFHIDDYFDKLMYQNYDIVILSLGNGLLTRFFSE